MKMKSFVGLLLIISLTFILLTSNLFAAGFGLTSSSSQLISYSGLGSYFDEIFNPAGLKFERMDHGCYVVFTLTAKRVSGWIECDIYGSGSNPPIEVVSWEVSVPCDWTYSQRTSYFPKDPTYPAFIVGYYNKTVSFTWTIKLRATPPINIYAFVGNGESRKEYSLSFSSPRIYCGR